MFINVLIVAISCLVVYTNAQSPTANPTAPTFLPTIMPTQVFGYYVGCYLDKNVRAVSLTLFDYVPVDVCKSRALNLGYRYFALQDYSQFNGVCFYTNVLSDFFRYGSLPTSDTGYAFDKCHYTTNTGGLRVAVGGGYANAVYDTQPPPPTFSPTFVPTLVPTIMPSVNPTPRPSLLPTAPTLVPSRKPTSSPTLVPSRKPTSSPTLVPSKRPTLAPTSKPSLAPSQKPSLAPSIQPSRKPTNQPTTMKPTNKRTSSPTNKKLKRNKIYMLCKSTDGGNSNCEWKNDGPTYRST